MTTLPLEDDRPRKLDLAVWGGVLRHARPYRRYLWGLAAAGLAVAAVDALLPLLTGLLIDEVSGLAGRAARPARLALLGGGYAALIVLLAACIGAFIWFAGRVVTGLGYDLRQGGFRRLQELSFSFYDRESTGWLVARLTSDCSKLSRVVPWCALDLVWGGGLMLSIALAMLALDVRLALAVLAIVPPLALLSLYFQRKLLESSRLVRRSNAIITASFGECLMGVRTTKALVRERENLREFQALSTDMFRHSMRNALQSAVYLPLVATFGSVGVGLALWQGGLALEGDLTLGTLVAFMQYAVLFAMPVRELAERFTQLQSAQAAAERVLDLLAAVPEVRDAPEVLAALEASAGVALPAGVAPDGGDARIETVEFAGVDFAYAPGEPVLQGFDLTVRAGQTVALVGATGGGKSTIVNLLARFYEPTAGEVRINGVDYRRRSLAWLQEQFGVVLQTPHLFAGTVRENLRYGRLDASDAEVEQAARLTGAHAFIEALEGGYEAEVGEGGCRLSTGQRQLVALARAVLKDPQIFVLDEATSSVDTEAERQIQDAIDAALAGRMAFVIAHRLSTIQAADLILVIDRGRIVEQGTHAELLERRGAYHDLWTRQFARAVAAEA